MTGLTPKQMSIAEEAADWFIRLEAGELSRAERCGFADWLRESPVHVQEFLFAAATFQALDSVAETDRVPAQALIERTVPEVVPLFTATTPGSARPPHRRLPGKSLGMWAFRGAAALLLLALGGVGLLSIPLLKGPAPVVIATAFGEQKSVPLDDGSVLYLNTQSKVVVRFSGKRRSLELAEGEALFKVAPDPSRPFRVHVDGSVVEAVGTIFNIYKQSGSAELSVVEGKVAVSDGASPAAAAAGSNRTGDNAGIAATFLTEGQEATILADGRVAQVKPFRKNAVLAWRERRLIFENEPLLAIAREFNRYNEAQIRVSDPGLLAQRFDGVFDANNPEAFINFLEVTAQVRTSRLPSGEIWLLPGGKGTP